MQFIRQNLFMVVLGAVLVLGGAILLVMNYGASESLAKNLKPREDLLRLIKGFKGGIPTVQLKERQARLEQLKLVSQQVASNCREWNSKTYPVMQLSTTVAGKAQNFAAFPVTDQYEKNPNLYWRFIETYLEQVNALRNSLQMASLATQEEIDKEVLKYSGQFAEEERHKKIQQEKDRASSAPASGAAARPAAAAPGVAGPGAMAPGGMSPMGGAPGAFGGAFGPGPGGPSGPGATAAGASDDVTSRARAKASEVLMARQANRGRIYVNPDAFDKVFEAPAPTALPKQLWDAQVNLWVQSDIVAAINQTNQEALATTQPTSQPSGGVPGSAVKRLIKITVEEQYVMPGGSTASSSGGGAPGSAAPAAMPPGGGVGGGGLMGGGGPMGGSPTPSYSGDSSSSSGGPSFTQRTCTRDYDVLQYRFIVVMPCRYIQALETNLMQRNLHTILKIEAAPLGNETTPTAAGRPVSAIGMYYGPDAVMEVTFQGELLLLTSWERDLMPKDVLAAFQGIAADQKHPNEK